MYKLNCLLLIFSLAMTSVMALADDTTKVETNMAAQVTACTANSAMEWSSTLNRCVGKVASRAARNDSKACNDLTDLAAREKCHLSVAEKSTGVSSDTDKLNQGSTTASMLLNGSVLAAYGIIALISKEGMKGLTSGCTSKKILGLTSAAGLASDAYLKITAKKKIKELENKYALATTSTAYEAQVKALEYLKEEQQTVVSIAGLEKKRNLALMLGYGVAAGFAAYELTFAGNNPDCFKPQSEETDKTTEGTTTITAKASPPAGAP